MREKADNLLYCQFQELVSETDRLRDAGEAIKSTNLEVQLKFTALRFPLVVF